MLLCEEHDGPLARLRCKLGIEDLQPRELLSNSVEVGTLFDDRAVVQPEASEVRQVNQRLDLAHVLQLVAEQADLLDLRPKLDVLDASEPVAVKVVLEDRLRRLFNLLEILLERRSWLFILAAVRQRTLLKVLEHWLEPVPQRLLLVEVIHGCLPPEGPDMVNEKDFILLSHILHRSTLAPDVYVQDDL